MINRKTTPDILSSLMEGERKSPQQKELGSVLSSSSDQKEKATFNLSKQVLKQLDACWMQIRQLRGEKVTKTRIVEQAIQEAIEEFNRKQQESRIYSRIDRAVLKNSTEKS